MTKLIINLQLVRTRKVFTWILCFERFAHSILVQKISGLIALRCFGVARGWLGHA